LTVTKSTKSRSDPLESAEQIGFVNWFETKFPGVRIFAIPNGGHRAISVAKAMKAEGVRPGVPDLFVPAWCLWIEMKRQVSGRVSKEQADWHRYLENVGHFVIVGKGATDASRQVVDFVRDGRHIAGRARCAGMGQTTLAYNGHGEDDPERQQDPDY
jgi:hypothetical protein